MIETKQVYIQQEQNNGTIDRSGWISGMRAVVYAMAAILQSFQNFSTELLALSAAQADLNKKNSQEWLDIITFNKDSDQAKIAKEAASGDAPDVKSAKLTDLNAKFQQHQLAYQQSRSFWTSQTEASQEVGQDTAEVMNIGSDSAQAMIDALKRVPV